jgi:hypothetical protein
MAAGASADDLKNPNHAIESAKALISSHSGNPSAIGGHETAIAALDYYNGSDPQQTAGGTLLTSLGLKH